MNERHETDFAWHLGMLRALLRKDDIQKLLTDSEITESEYQMLNRLLSDVSEKVFFKGRQ
jgi:hypothetical protein